MLPLQVAIALLTFIAASALVLLQESAAIVSYHVIFAVGIVPLILSAMVHFVPVLTRSKNPGRMIKMLPTIALIGGILVTGHFAFPQFVQHGQYFGAVIVIAVTISLGYWAYRSGRKAIGAPHPCLNWYLAAMACLLVALDAILMAYFIPSQYAALRLLHLHLNTLGFIGITALGTLQVLVPTAAHKLDPQVTRRMHDYLKWTVAGTVLIACGAAWHSSFSWLGLALLAIPLFGIFKSWLPLYSNAMFMLYGAVPVLSAALCGYIAAVTLGVVHAYLYSSANPVATFIIAFLVPLVTGAVSFLLPLWLYPGQQTAWHHVARKYLGFGGGLRAIALLVGGVLAGLGYRAGWILAMVTVCVFLIQIILMFMMIAPSLHSLQSTTTRRDNAGPCP